MKGLQNGDMAVKDAERQNIAAFGRGDCKGNDGGRHLPYNDFGSSNVFSQGNIPTCVILLTSRLTPTLTRHLTV